MNCRFVCSNLASVAVGAQDVCWPLSNRQCRAAEEQESSWNITSSSLQTGEAAVARMLTVGVDTAAGVVNLHMVTRAGSPLWSSCQRHVKETQRFFFLNIHMKCCKAASRGAFNGLPWQRFRCFFSWLIRPLNLALSICKRIVMWPLRACSPCH